jgi:hypothetical protein
MKKLKIDDANVGVPVTAGSVRRCASDPPSMRNRMTRWHGQQVLNNERLAHPAHSASTA